jgi:acyl-coenzyme A synthetase/AMP-(fatty) acid ligase
VWRGGGWDANVWTVPKYVFWVDTYPKTASGKIQKFRLREVGIGLMGEGKGLE